MARSIKPLDLFTILLTLAAAASGVLFLKKELVEAKAPVTPDSTLADWKTFAANGVRIGPESAEVTVVMFSDIRCVHCRETWTLLKEMRERYPDNLAIVYRHYPFKGQSLVPALSGICASHQNGFEALYDRYILTYDSLPADSSSLAKSLEAEGWVDLARNSGIVDLGKFIGCLTEDQTLRELAMDRDAARLLGVAVVPTLLVNDTRVVGNPGYARLVKMLQRTRTTQ